TSPFQGGRRQRRSLGVLARRQDDGVLAVQLFHEDVHALSNLDVHALAHDVRRDGELTAAPVDHDGQLDERRADGTAGVEHVVHDHDVLAVDVHRNAGGTDHRTGTHGLQIIAVQRDVERALGDGGLLAIGDQRDDAGGELHATALDADDHEAFGAVVQLDDLVRHAPEGTRERSGVQYGARRG